MTFRGLMRLVGWGFMACPVSFPLSRGEKHPDPKSGQEVDPDKLGCTMTCRVDETDPKNFAHFFLDFHSRSPTLATDPRIAELVKGLLQWNTHISTCQGRMTIFVDMLV